MVKFSYSAAAVAAAATPLAAFAHEGHSAPIHEMSGALVALALVIGIAAYRVYSQKKNN